MGADLRKIIGVTVMWNKEFMGQAVWLTVKIVAILLLSNASQSFFVYQNF